MIRSAPAPSEHDLYREVLGRWVDGVVEEIRSGEISTAGTALSRADAVRLLTDIKPSWVSRFADGDLLNVGRHAQALLRKHPIYLALERKA
jgi:hypothetical protein